MLYQILKWFHIVLALIAVGANATYAVWIQSATADRKALPFTLRGIKLIDDRMANPAYGLLLLTGVLMALNAQMSLLTPWLLLSLILWFLALLAGIFGYAPTLRRQIALAESEGPDGAAYQAVAGRGMRLGIALGGLVMIIIYLMVFKPALWG